MAKEYEDYAYVVSGPVRKEVVKLLGFPRTPTELYKIMKVHPNVISRILNDLERHGLIMVHDISWKRKVYRITKKGELARMLLHSLVDGFLHKSEIGKSLDIHEDTVESLLADLSELGMIKATSKKYQKLYQLTDKGKTGCDMLHSLARPHTNLDLIRLLRIHRRIINRILKDLMKKGFVSMLRFFRPARKLVELTSKGESVRNKMT